MSLCAVCWSPSCSNAMHRESVSTTWPEPAVHTPDTEENEARRAQIRAFLEKQYERRTMWRKRRGWETP